MMVLSCVLLSLASLVVALKVYGRLFNPVTLYTVPFAICVCLACTGLFGIYRPSDVSVGYITLGIAGFGIGSLLISGVGAASGATTPLFHSKAPKETRLVRRRLFIGILTVAVLASIPYLIKTLPILFGHGGLTAVKFEYANGEGSTLFTTRELLLFSWFMLPAFNLAFLVFCYGLSELRVDVPALVFSILGMASAVCISGGRNNVFIFLVLAAMSLLMSPYSRSIWSKIRALPGVVKVLVAVGIVVLIYITQERSLSADLGVLENVFFYFAGAVTYFSQIVSNPSMFDLGGDLFYGGALFGFVTNPVEILLALVTGGHVRGTENLVSTAASVYLNFSSSLKGNALCTCLYPFMRDFGTPGIFIGPLLYGTMAGFVWGKWRQAFDGGSEAARQRWFMVAAYLSYALLFSVWRYVPLFTSTGMIFLFIFLITSRPAFFGKMASHRVKGRNGSDAWQDLPLERGLL